MVVGYTTVETLKTVAGTLLNKPGGYISNDRFRQACGWTTRRAGNTACWCKCVT